MSYLDPPRLVFSGTFQADVSTVNNDPEHFDTARFRPNYWNAADDITDGWWNPWGTGSFRFGTCSVQSTTSRDGETSATRDPAVGMVLGDTAGRVPGRMVDLDPDNQLVSQIWGWTIFLARPTGEKVLSGRFEPSAFADLWKRVDQGGGDSTFAAYWQSVLTDLEWGDVTDSSVLSDLEAGSSGNGLLSIKFVLDATDDNPASPAVTFGRIVGSIGQHGPAEARTFVDRRRLDPVPGGLRAQCAPAVVGGEIVWLDLSNSLGSQQVGAVADDLGPLSLWVGETMAAPLFADPNEYVGDDWYTTTAGIVGVRLPEILATRAQAEPLSVFTPSGPLLVEAADGLLLRSDTTVMRADPNQSRSARIYARRFGQPAAGVDVAFGFDTTVLDQQTVLHPDRPGPTCVGLPTDAVHLPTDVRTGTDGTADIDITTADPGTPRGYIDGQVYQATYGPGSKPPPTGSVTEPSRMLNLLVWSGTSVPDKPTWTRDIVPIFGQYAALYPVMRPIIDLANFGDVVSKRDLLRYSFGAEEADPRFMPVTRDLSGAKRELILQWLEDPIFFDADDPEDLARALQVAIELEHATIPPYLCALFSIRPGTNRHVEALLRSVVTQEMGHLVMAANLLVSLGGAPALGEPGFVPRYPGPVPGGLANGLTLRLRRLSIEQIRDVFLPIERPSVLSRMLGHDQTGGPTFREPHTIESLYEGIERSLTALAGNQRISFGNVDRQITNWLGAERTDPILDLDTALNQLDLIVRQGAGTGPDDPTDADGTDGGDAELAHYYRFTEIIEGRALVNDGARWAYDGDVIPLDEDGILPMVDDPEITKFEPGSRARFEAESFSNSYRALLAALHDAFNGRPARFDDALALMHNVAILGRRLAATPLADGSGENAGPVF